MEGAVRTPNSDPNLDPDPNPDTNPNPNPNPDPEQAWKELLLQRLYEHVPQVKGHVAYADAKLNPNPDPKPNPNPNPNPSQASLCLRVPTGAFLPCFVTGAALGRALGQVSNSIK